MSSIAVNANPSYRLIAVAIVVSDPLDGFVFSASEAGLCSVNLTLYQAACTLARAEHAVKAAALIVAATRFSGWNGHVEDVFVVRSHFEES